jgi:hypothetical protein
MIVQLSITVANVNALLLLSYTRIEIWASTDQGNSYQEVTSSVAGPAVLVSSSPQTTFNMSGKLLSLSINGAAEVSIPFASSPVQWTSAQVVNRINEVVPGLASLDGTKVKMTSPTTGRVSSLKVTYNDASELGLPAGTLVFGTDARPTLTMGQLIYTYTDVAGRSDNRYKWRFSLNGANPISEFSERVFGSAPPLSGIPVSVGTALFVGLDGKPQKRRIVVVSDRPPASISGAAVGNELPLIVDSDDSGFLQVPLVQGAVVRVAIEGTAYVREFTVPATDSFDLLSVMASAPDPFTIQVPAPFLIRRNLIVPQN